ncbi:hypothetical protein OPU71_07005 [Niveibacterium sp. 24ML]|uniref:hypothetical protein n=1 Tax=Niveibacterium sp. 24ML TaxID=2985512 RepID=UPI0022706871|nr:hypothetical protein [Niveibacterium sp. 24ML]MCX9155876.1 hypothetical protein [Niveibacterium sp. 24ML]
MKPSNETAPAQGAGVAFAPAISAAREAGGWEACMFVESLLRCGDVMTSEEAAQAFADILGEIVCAGSAADWNDEVQARFDGFVHHIGMVLHGRVKP